eukprot:51339_1
MHVLRNEEEETIQDMIDQENQTKKAKLKLKLNEGSLMLNEQYRMTPFMMRFCNEQFYDSLIDTGTGDGYVIQGGGLDRQSLQRIPNIRKSFKMWRFIRWMDSSDQIECDCGEIEC